MSPSTVHTTQRKLLFAAHSVLGTREDLQDNYFCSLESLSRGGTVTGWAQMGSTQEMPTPEGAQENLNNLMDFPVEPELTDVRLFALADGVGGRNRGDLAAEVAVQHLRFFYQPGLLRQRLEDACQKHSLVVPREKKAENLPYLTSLLQSTYQLINLELHHHSVQDIRTTLTTVALDFPRLFLANVGDSRVYRLPRLMTGELGSPERLTVDDSYLDRKIYEGEYLPFAPCSYEVAGGLRALLEDDGRYSLEFIFDLSRLEVPDQFSFEEKRHLAQLAIQEILADGSARKFRRAMQLGSIAPAHQIKEEGLLRVLGHQEWLESSEVHSTIRQSERRLDAHQEPIYSLNLSSGDLLLLCSDGLTDVLSESRIHNFLQDQLDAQQNFEPEGLSLACQRLVELAEHDENCSDNVSAILIQMPCIPEENLPEQEANLPNRSRRAFSRNPGKSESKRNLQQASHKEKAEKEPADTSVPSTQAPEPDRAFSGASSLQGATPQDRTATQLVQAIKEKKSMDHQLLEALDKLHGRLASTEDALLESRMALNELSARVNGMSRRLELLDRLGRLPLLAVACLLLLLLLLGMHWGGNGP